jgi:hypothetical protein
MRLPHDALLLAVAVVASSIASCKNLGGKPDCNKACDHLVDLAREDVKAQNAPDHIKKALLEQLDKSRADEVAACVTKCQSGDWNGNCLLEKKTLTEAKDCK